MIVTESGTVSSGGTISRATLMLVWAVPILPLESVAVKVKVLRPNGNTAGASLLISAIDPSTLSVAVTDARKSTTSAEVVLIPASVPTKPNCSGASITGPVLSATVSTADPVPELPFASIAVNVIVVSPTGSKSGASLLTDTAVSTLSVAEAWSRKATTASSLEGVPFWSTAATSIASGTETSGAVWSSTVSTAVAVLLLPAASVAVKLTVVSPNGIVAGASVETARVPSTLSIAEPAERNAAISASVERVPLPSVAATTLSLGAVTAGAVRSTTTTFADTVLAFPAASTAVKTTVVVPRGKISTALLVIVTELSILSTAEAPLRNTVISSSDDGVPDESTAATLMLAGASITGALKSAIVTTALAVVAFPSASCALKMTVVAPTGN